MSATGHNELSQAASPYLLQHANNPVHWRMWGEAALTEATALNKPILLSIGYAACHWCHVMAHESFEDDATAAVMNELFVNIKVDREERPDIDHIYMSALHALGERGGWPLTMFLTPAGEPFWGGTYFPKESNYGRPSFVSVLKTVAEAFRNEPARIKQNTEVIGRALSKAAPSGGDGGLDLSQLDALAPQIVPIIDPVAGGLNGAPKFPNTPILELLWRAGARLGREPYRDLVKLTLTNMSEGGIYDHLGGGFARYSTDAQWLVPHFEKMLYDNAQILEMLALCHHEYGGALFRTRAQETVGWLAREMTNPEGAFCASIDADSEGVEGKFYVWTYGEHHRAARAGGRRVFWQILRCDAIWKLGRRGAWRPCDHPQPARHPKADFRRGSAAGAVARETFRGPRKARPAWPRRQDSRRLEWADDRRARPCRDAVS